MDEFKFDLNVGDENAKLGVALGVSDERTNTLNAEISSIIALSIVKEDRRISIVLKQLVRKCQTLEEVVWCTFAATKALDVYDAMFKTKSPTNVETIAEAVKAKPRVADLMKKWKEDKSSLTESPRPSKNRRDKPSPVTPTVGEPFKLYVDTSIEDFYGAFGLTRERGREIDNYIKDYLRFTEDEGKMDLRYVVEDMINHNSLNKQEAMLAIYGLGQVLGKAMEAGYAKGGPY